MREERQVRIYSERVFLEMVGGPIKGSTLVKIAGSYSKLYSDRIPAEKAGIYKTRLPKKWSGEEKDIIYLVGDRRVTLEDMPGIFPNKAPVRKMGEDMVGDEWWMEDEEEDESMVGVEVV